MFIHGGIIHLVCNLMALLFAGVILELAIGSRTLFIVYMLAGVASGVASIAFNESVVSVGASGAIWGLYGFALAFLFSKRLDKSLAIFIGPIIIAFVLVNVLVNFSGKIGLPWHLGGLVSEFAVGVVYLLLERLFGKTGLSGKKKISRKNSSVSSFSPIWRKRLKYVDFFYNSQLTCA